MKMLSVCVLPLALFLQGSGCGNETDRRQGEETENMVAEANRQVGMPRITNFTERRFTRQILEMRDNEVATFSYFLDLQGQLHFLCESVGYGLPYSTQFVNPERYVVMNGGTLPQAEPNGLFMPSESSATWVLCSDGEGGVRPVYTEPLLIVSPFRLNARHSLKAED